MTNSKVQQQAFQDRLNRIREKQGQPPLPSQAQHRAQLAAEAAAAIPAPKAKAKSAKPVSPVPSVWENLGYPMSILGAFVLGLLAVFASNYAMFHLFGADGGLEDPVFTMVGNGVLAAGLGFVVRNAMKFEGKEFTTANTAGIILMVASIHNLFHFVPGPMAMMYSPDHVAMMVDSSVPYSLNYGGDYFVLHEAGMEAATAAPAMPTYFRAGQ
ncbi:MAG: hypothetical protein AAGM21_02185 [Pseudomonadota bacterium]